MMTIQNPCCRFNGATGEMENVAPVAPGVLRATRRTLKDLEGIFLDAAAFAAMDPSQTIYRGQLWQPMPEGTPNALQFGTSVVAPGFVGGEYFMTKGHVHACRERPEVYWGLRGEGVLLLQDEDGACRAEHMFSGSVHHIAGHVAHRVVNTGGEVLAVGACWPLDAGHDYDALGNGGFACRVLCKNGRPVLYRI